MTSTSFLVCVERETDTESYNDDVGMYGIMSQGLLHAHTAVSVVLVGSANWHDQFIQYPFGFRLCVMWYQIMCDVVSDYV